MVHSTIRCLLLFVLGPPAPASSAQDVIAFVSDRDGGGVFSKDEGGLTCVLEGRFGLCPVWSPDGSELTFLGAREEDMPILAARNIVFHFILLAVDAEGRNLRRITKTPVAMDSVRWSPDGQRLVFESCSEDVRNFDSDGIVSSAIYVVDKDGKNEQRLTDIRGYHSDPRWSSDGRNVLYLTHEPESPRGPKDVYAVSPDGKEKTRITHESRGVTAALWFGEDKVVVQIGAERGVGNKRIPTVIVSMDGKERRELEKAPGKLLGVSSDWKYVFFQRQSVFRMDVSTGEIIELTTGVESLGDAVLSPEKEHLLFRAKGDGSTDLYMIGTDGKGLRVLVDHPSNDRQPALRPRTR